jgi:Helix-turn-helix domain
MTTCRPAPGIATVKSPAVLASPVRIELIGALQTHGPTSIRELARYMSRPADGLYHHVRLLLQAGVIRQTDERKTGRHQEAIYGLVAPRIGAALDPASGAGRQAAVRAGHAALRLAAREFAAAVDACAKGGSAKSTPAPRESRQKAWLTDRALSRLLTLQKKIEKLLNAQNRHCRGRLYVLTTVLSPVVKRGRR